MEVASNETGRDRDRHLDFRYGNVLLEKIRGALHIVEKYVGMCGEVCVCEGGGM